MEGERVTSNAVEQPVQSMISRQADIASDRESEDIRTLRALAAKIEDIFHAVPKAARVHNDWDQESTTVRLEIDPDRANLAAVTNSALASSTPPALTASTLPPLRTAQNTI